MRTLVIHRVIGSGAIGKVYVADLVEDAGTREVAVKVLAGERPADSGFHARVRDEARLGSLLADPDILQVHGLVRIAGRDAVVMEYVEGCDLAVLLSSGQRLPPRAAAQLAATVAAALHRAHCAQHPDTGEPLGIIHRDVKPGNLLLTESGGIKLLDFGVARATFSARESETGAFVLGTLNYMAPEYARTGDVSPAVDLFGLALTVWEGITGEVFGQPKVHEDAHKARVHERIERLPRSHAPLGAVLRGLLSWNPEERPDGDQAAKAFTAMLPALGGADFADWCAEAVPAARRSRPSLVSEGDPFTGRTLVVETEADAAPAPMARPRPQPARMDQPRTVFERTDPPEPAPSPTEISPRRTPPPARPPPALVAPAASAHAVAVPPPLHAILTPPIHDSIPSPTLVALAEDLAPPRAAARRKPGTSGLRVAVQGIAIGAGVGLVLLGILSVTLLLARML